MKQILLLSSGKFLQNRSLDFFEKHLSKYRLAHITTAAYGRGVANHDHLERIRKFFKNNDIVYEDLDIAGKTESELRETLKNFDGVFVNGGSSFYLLKAIRESGFERIIKELLPTGCLYIGASAGSYVACPTIEMALWKHIKKYYHYELKDLTAMNFVPFLIYVHYKPEYEKLVREGASKSRYEVRTLTDNQAVLIKGDQEFFLTSE